MEKTEDQRLREAILEVINNQMRDNDPPETKQAFLRLQKEGFSKEETLKLIGCVVASEVFTVLRENRPYDNEKYISALKALPKLPWDKEG
ncbi:hypothetical protein ACFLZQ_08335 [Thermodesulfobacteriota bacterium]